MKMGNLFLDNKKYENLFCLDNIPSAQVKPS